MTQEEWEGLAFGDILISKEPMLAVWNPLRPQEKYLLHSPARPNGWSTQKVVKGTEFKVLKFVAENLNHEVVLKVVNTDRFLIVSLVPFDMDDQMTEVHLTCFDVYEKQTSPAFNVTEEDKDKYLEILHIILGDKMKESKDPDLVNSILNEVASALNRAIKESKNWRF